MKVFRVLLVGLTLFIFPCFASAENLLVIKYRSDPVDVDKPYFEYLDTSKSSLVRGAWYDAKNKYMIINLNGTNYHYCGLDEGTWNQFKNASSYGTTYGKMIKGRYDCRVNPVPEYRGVANYNSKSKETLPPEFYSYLNLIKSRIKKNWKWIKEERQDLVAKVTIEIEPSGKISNFKIAKSSGYLLFDQSVEMAVLKSSPLPPPPSNIYKYFQKVQIKFDPRE